jgi:hypothetical protein
VGYSPGNQVPDGTLAITRGVARWGPSLGIGWRVGLPAGRLEALEIEANGTSIFPAWHVNENAAQVNALRVTGVVRLVPHLALLAGVACNVAVGQDGRDADLSLAGPQSVMHDGQTTVRIYPGFVAGLQM